MTTTTSTYRNRIIESSRVMFVRDGIAKTSLNKLCRELHIAKKTFYLHFENKDALLAALVDHTRTQYAICAQSAADPELSDFDRARSVLVGLCEVSAQLVSAGFLEELSQTNPALWKEISDDRQRLIPVIFDWLVEAQTQGDVRKDIDLENLKSIAELLLDRVLDPVELERRGLAVAPTARLVFNLLFDGISAHS